MTNTPRSITVVIGLSTITIMLLSYLLSANLQSPLYFIQAQNSTNVSQNDTSKISIPTTISKKAQEMLKNMTMNLLPSFVTPAPDDLEGWKKLNQQLSSTPIYGSQLTVDSYQPNI